jgi:hypothetical protein
MPIKSCTMVGKRGGDLLHALCCGNVLGQYLHFHGFSPVWIRMCCCRDWGAENLSPQVGQVQHLSTDSQLIWSKTEQRYLQPV